MEPTPMSRLARTFVWWRLFGPPCRVCGIRGGQVRSPFCSDDHAEMWEQSAAW